MSVQLVCFQLFHFAGVDGVGAGTRTTAIGTDGLFYFELDRVTAQR